MDTENWLSAYTALLIIEVQQQPRSTQGYPAVRRGTEVPMLAPTALLWTMRGL